MNYAFNIAYVWPGWCVPYGMNSGLSIIGVRLSAAATAMFLFHISTTHRYGSTSIMCRINKSKQQKIAVHNFGLMEKRNECEHRVFSAQCVLRTEA